MALVLIVIALVTLSIRTWANPKYPERIDPASITPAAKAHKPLVLNRRVNHSGLINATVQGNLFRKDRKEFMPPPPPPVPVAQVARASNLPPPNLKLKGVVFLGNSKIAIMEGNYPVQEANNAIKQKPLKRKGYPLGSQIGNFELTEIEKNRVTLDNKRGVVLNLNLSDRPDDKVIRKVGNTLIQKNKNFDPKKIKRPPPPRKASTNVRAKRQINRPKPVPAPRSFRVSGAPTAPSEGKSRPHISGR
ncbi:MAG: hypothetical protein NPINA01_09540 [Nitrospinaceae bacterium]|nr:MAG: hypothetical protein NPINA01_09540 [Nitrospinaceae bacterium]